MWECRWCPLRIKGVSQTSTQWTSNTKGSNKPMIQSLVKRAPQLPATTHSQWIKPLWMLSRIMRKIWEQRISPWETLLVGQWASRSTCRITRPLSSQICSKTPLNSRIDVGSSSEPTSIWAMNEALRWQQAAKRITSWSTSSGQVGRL